MSAVTEADIKIYNSTNGLGGVITSNEIITGDLHNIFDRVTPDEALTGSTNYRCVYIRNTAASTLFSAVLSLTSNTPSESSNLLIGLGSSVIGGTEQSISAETIAPVGITFTDAIDYVQPIGDLTTTTFKAIWLQRVIHTDADAVAIDGVSISIQGVTEG